MRSALKSKWLFPAAVFAALLCAAPARAQEPATDDDEGSRQIKFNGISKARPAAPSTGTSTNNKGKTTTAPPVYKRVDTGAWNPTPPQKTAAANTAPPAPKPKRGTRPPRRITHTAQHPKKTAPVDLTHAPTATGDFLDIGVTVWRLRPSKKAEAAVSFLTADDLAERVTPVRLSGTDPVQLGDRLRFSIESPLTGYLYVINRTQYEDGTVGEPSMIFPTTRMHGGDNRVAPGRLVYIPALEDSPSYFRVTADAAEGRANAGEIINIIISPKPIPELAAISRDKVRISSDMLAKWTSTWGDVARQQQLELVGGEGQPATVAEHEAGESGSSRSLTQDEPFPQNIYRVPSNPNGPSMVTVQLIYKESAPKKSSARR